VHLGEALATVRADSANLQSYQTATAALDFAKAELTRSLILRLATNAQVANAQKWPRTQPLELKTEGIRTKGNHGDSLDRLFNRMLFGKTA
jgi:hypothetical protein